MRGSGRITKWMVLENCIMRVVNWLIKVVGLKMNLMVWVRFTMTTQLIFHSHLIIQISICLKIIGNTIKVC